MNLSETLIGPSALVAEILTAKAARLKRTGGRPLKVLLFGAPGLAKTHIALKVAETLTKERVCIDHRNGKEVTVELVRDWISDLAYRNAFGEWQVKIVDELDRCTRDAQDLLLTFLDRMPPGCAFIGTSNLELECLQERFQTRLQQLRVEAPTAEEIVALLRSKKVPRDVAEQIAAGCNGNVRAALLDAEDIPRRAIDQPGCRRTMKNRYRNPWAKRCLIPKPDFYENDAPCVFTHRGVQVFRVMPGSFDYVFAGCCIAQRAGYSNAAEAIDHILDGRAPVTDELAEHLTAHGFKPITYAYYSANWQRIDDKTALLNAS